jgi:hypothetical protein
MRQAFDIESINLDDLIATALNDPKAPIVIVLCNIKGSYLNIQGS